MHNRSPSFPAEMPRLPLIQVPRIPPALFRSRRAINTSSEAVSRYGSASCPSHIALSVISPSTVIGILMCPVPQYADVAVLAPSLLISSNVHVGPCGISVVRAVGEITCLPSALGFRPAFLGSLCSSGLSRILRSRIPYPVLLMFLAP